MRKLSKIEQFWLDENTGKLTAEEIAGELKGVSTKSVEKYLEKLGLQNLEVETPTPQPVVVKNDQFDLSPGDELIIEDNYKNGLPIPTIAKQINKAEEAVKMFIASKLRGAGREFYGGKGQISNRRVATVMTERGSEHFY